VLRRVRRCGQIQAGAGSFYTVRTRKQPRRLHAFRCPFTADEARCQRYGEFTLTMIRHLLDIFTRLCKGLPTTNNSPGLRISSYLNPHCGVFSIVETFLRHLVWFKPWPSSRHLFNASSECRMDISELSVSACLKDCNIVRISFPLSTTV